VQYDLKRLEKGKVEVGVDITRAEFDAAYDKVLVQFGADITVAGFRPGKVPADVIENKVGASKILNETASHLISTHVSDILKKEDIVPLDSPKIAIETLAKNSPFVFTISFTQKPVVKVGDWKKIRVKKVAAKPITDKEVGESIMNIFEAWQKQKAVKSQSQSEESEGVKEPESQESKKFIYDAHGEKIFLTDDAKGTEPTNGSKGTIGISGQAKIDDEFAKAVGARDLAHLRELVKKDLETIVADQVEIKLEEEIFEKIRETGDVEVPEVLVEDELNRILVRLNSQLEKAGQKLEEFLVKEKTTIDELKGKWREQAEKNVKTSLIMDQIGKEEEVKVSKEEVDGALAGVTETNLSAEQKEDMERYVVFSIFQAKTMDLVKRMMIGGEKGTGSMESTGGMKS